MAGRYLEDFTTGEEFLSPWRRIAPDDLRDFARITGESNPLHVDPEFAARSRYGALVASGCFGLSLALGLLDELELFHGTAIGSLGIADWRFHRPLLVDARVRSRLTVLGTRRRRSVPGEGIVDRGIALLHEDGEVLQEGRTAILVKARATR